MELAHKVTLSTGKTVLLRELKNKHIKLATKAAGNKGGGNQTLAMLEINEELLKILVLRIDDKGVKPVELENIDDMFTFTEYQQLQQYIQKNMGSAEGEATGELIGHT